MSPEILHHATVRSIEQVARDTYLICSVDEQVSCNARAGQFLEIKVPHCAEILWRRPFSIHNTQPQKHTFDILFQTIGQGTHRLAHLAPDSELDILGPLGNHFYYEREMREAIVVAGGLGIAPFMLMMRELAQRRIPMQLFYGVGSSDQFCCLPLFEKYATLHLSTIDGSLGHQGLVTDLLSDYLDRNSDNHGKSLFVCGPTPMLHKVKEIAACHTIAAQASVETVMACGFGACVGCAVPMTNPVAGQKEYFLACKDGPVFDMREIVIDD
ncbi:dihydroorotate dehydrogenase electron transfer subunit [candidate division KSB1 bacterium]|nr:dihydroorotate dehydrogenase electron transfer subunit [candidate division KSB1 bacterium]